MMPQVLRVIAGFLSAASLVAAEEPWDVRLAGKFSTRLQEIRSELRETAPPLEKLPGIPIDDQGGTGGYAAIYPKAAPADDAAFAVEVRWPENAAIDLIVLVPTRRYDAKGLDPQYGMPDDFTVELLDESGAVITRVARERNARGNPVRHGHPFVFRVEPAVEAAGLRISANLLHPDAEEEGSFVHAWAEVFAFEGDRNVARDAEVESIGGASPPAPWRWQTAFLVDGQTPLGLPEIPAKEHLNIGWLSNGRQSADESAALTVDLGAPVSMDAVRLLPARRPTSDLPSGFGFPQELEISISETNEPVDSAAWKVVTERSFRNPGHNPVTVSFEPVSGRFVKIEATKLWKAYEDYPAFFALSEVEVLDDDTNLALGKPVRSSDGMLNLIAPGGRYWSGAALSDGFGPDGLLVSAREWMLQLDQRLRIETRATCCGSRLTGSSMAGGTRRSRFMRLLGLAGAFAIIALPIRYRIHANRELRKSASASPATFTTRSAAISAASRCSPISPKGAPATPTNSSASSASPRKPSAPCATSSGCSGRRRPPHRHRRAPAGNQRRSCWSRWIGNSPPTRRRGRSNCRGGQPRPVPLFPRGAAQHLRHAKAEKIESMSSARRPPDASRQRRGHRSGKTRTPRHPARPAPAIQRAMRRSPRGQPAGGGDQAHPHDPAR
jgi:hypothetical protein